MTFFFKIQDLPFYLLIILAVFYPFFNRSTGDKESSEIELIVNRKTVSIFDRAIDSIYSFNNFSIEIKDGQARVVNSSCIDHLCEKYGWLDSLSHDRVICLPNKMILKNRVLQDSEFDDITE